MSTPNIRKHKRFRRLSNNEATIIADRKLVEKRFGLGSQPRRAVIDYHHSACINLVDAMSPGAFVLFNESFASTNEREGSEIARQIVCALHERGIKVFFVTHLYAFAHDLHERAMAQVLFLRAERQDDGTRTFRIKPGEPLATSYGKDLYHETFADRDR